MPYKLLWMPKVLIDAGLKVAEVSGWQTRGHGDVGQIRGILLHHTAGSSKGNMPSLNVVTKGRSDLPGPLCNLGLGRDGTWYIVAAGRASHAGRGNWQGITNGNSQMIGVEAENTGVGEPWLDIQMDSYARGCAAILKHIKENAIKCCGHKEYALPQGRKIDPTFNMDEFRLRVGALMGDTAPQPSLVPPVDTGTGRPTLKRGDRNEHVKFVQEKLGINSDGHYGSKTEAAVREYQRKNKLVPDGRVGPRTWAALLAEGKQ